MNKIAFSFLVAFTIFTNSFLTAESLSSVINLLQTTSQIADFFSQPDIQEYINGDLAVGYTSLGGSIFPYLGSIVNNITFLTDIYNQKTISSQKPDLGVLNPQPVRVADQLDTLSRLISSQNQFPSTDLYNVYKAAVTTPNGNTYIAPSAYTPTNLQYIKTLIIDLANLANQLSNAMYNLILDDSNKITDANDPLNEEILKAQVIQDGAFILNIALIYIASLIPGTPNTATIQLDPQVSCSNTITQSIMAVINPATGTTQATIISSLLNGSASGTIPTTTTTITITPFVIYAGVCSFVNAYDANSTSGPYQTAITNMIALNNAIQSL